MKKTPTFLIAKIKILSVVVCFFCFFDFVKAQEGTPPGVAQLPIIKRNTPLYIPRDVQRRFLEAQQLPPAQVQRLLQQGPALMDFYLNHYTSPYILNSKDGENSASYRIPVNREQDYEIGKQIYVNIFDIEKVQNQKNPLRARREINPNQVPQNRPYIVTPRNLKPPVQADKSRVSETKTQTTPQSPSGLKAPTTQPTTEAEKFFLCTPDDFNTEAKSHCLDCTKLQTDFSNLVKARIDYFFRKKIPAGEQEALYDSQITVICETCGNVDPNKFVNYIEQRSKKVGVPSELIMSIMFKESGGASNLENAGCNAVSGANCHGLLQPNPKDSSILKSGGNDKRGRVRINRLDKCGKEVKKASDQKLREDCKHLADIPKRKRIQCLSGGSGEGNHNINKCAGEQQKLKGEKNLSTMCLKNPYCNFEEALAILLRKRKEMETTDKAIEATEESKGKSWTEISKEERNKWRVTMAHYLGVGKKRGQRAFLNKARKELRTANQDADPNDFEQLRKHWLGSTISDLPRRCNICISDDKNQENEGTQGSKENRNCVKPDSTKVSECVRRSGEALKSLAYVEAITGREKQCGLNGSIMEKWKNYRKQNPKISCPE